MTLQRREFITLLGGAAGWPIAVRAQQGDRMRRVGALMNLPADDQEAQTYMAMFQQGLQERGWSVGRNLRIDHRWGPSTNERIRQQAAELVALKPDVILWSGSIGGQAIQNVSRTVPVVMAQSIDPVGAGIVASLARPEGNITGFAQFEYSLSGKWLQLSRRSRPASCASVFCATPRVQPELDSGRSSRPRPN